ncbi:hypothetical protein PWT90_03237 [Aphanocladium album]|nr:hypothetical protein PWT90_03237 [Aphanocladium album]
MFAIVPAVATVLSMPYYLKLLVRDTPLVRPGLLLWAKLAADAALLGVYAASLALWRQVQTPKFGGSASTAVAAAAMSLVAAICWLGKLPITHIYEKQPSAFLSIVLALTGLA